MKSIPGNYSDTFESFAERKHNHQSQIRHIIWSKAIGRGGAPAGGPDAVCDAISGEWPAATGSPVDVRRGKGPPWGPLKESLSLRKNVEI